MLDEKPLVDDPLAPSNRCKDLDEDCDDLCHFHCWLHDPSQGWCPFLVAADQPS